MPGGSDLVSSDSWQTTNNALANGSTEHRYDIWCIAGRTYYFSLCADDGGSANYDSYICLLEGYGCSTPEVAHNDDECGTASSLVYTPSSNSWYSIIISGYNTYYGAYTLAYKHSIADMMVPASGSNSYTTCSGHLYDNGGLNYNYASSSNGYTTIYPAITGNKIRLTGNYYTEDNYDYVYIYNGVGTGGTLLYSGSASSSTSIGTITSTDATGALTVRLTSDGSVENSGFDFTIACIEPDYRATFISMDTGSPTWCAGETRTVSVTVQNTGAQAWTNSSPDINIGIKWDGDPDYLVRTDANGLASGETGTYSLTVTAPIAGSNHLTFDVVNELAFWFANQGNGSLIYTSSAQTIFLLPTEVSVEPNQIICAGADVQLTSSVNPIGGNGSISPNLEIEDNSTIISSISISSSMNANNISAITLDISHTWDSDLDIILYAPNGSSIILSNNNGGGGDNYTSTTFMNGGSYINITAGAAPFTGNYLPEESMSNLTGTANGGWILSITDNANGDEGTLNSWSITFPTTSYSWLGPNDFSSSLQNPTINNITAAEAGTYTISASYGGGCSLSANTTVTVNTLSTAPTAVSATNNPLCLGTSTTLSPVGGSLGTGGNAVWYTGADGGFTQDWVTNPYGSGGTAVNSVTSGILNITSINGDPMIFMGGLGSYDPNIYRYVTIRYQITAGTGGSWEIFFYNSNHAYAVGAEEVAGSLISDGAWHTSTIDMWSDPDYRTGGNITGWRFDWAGNSGVTMNIDYITLTASSPLTSTVAPTTNTTYYVRYEGQCNTTAYASQMISISTPATTSLSSGDYIWSGNTSTNWNTSSNWLTYNGSTFTVASSIPTTANNVFVRSYGTCASNVATINATTASVKSLNIEPGKILTMSGQTLNVLENWTNTGTFNAGNGTVNFNGTSPQVISGNNTFNNVSFNTNAISIVSPTIINGTATFSEGIISYSGTGSLSFGNTANAVVSSNNSFVDGAVSKTGSAAFTFPVGDIISRDIGAGIQVYSVLGAINLQPISATTISVNYHFDNSEMPDWWEHGGNMDVTLDHVSDREHWIVNSSNNISTSSLYWYDNGHATGSPCIHGFDDENPSEFVASDLSVAYWNGSMWIDAGGSTVGNHDEGYIVSSSIPFQSKGQKIMTFGSKNDANPLPVNLLYFAGNCEENEVLLNWKTATEINNDYFIIEKSADTEVFRQIGSLEGAGNSISERTYQFIDIDPYDESYYRLKQVDYNGDVTIHNIIYVSCYKNTPEFYPNPTKDKLFLNEKVNYKLFSLDGKMIKEGFGNSLTLGEFSPGVYMLKINNNYFYKVVKQ
jgi:subtilisin-like proprotein convertase family protein